MMTSYGLLDIFDSVFASSYTCFLPPPVDTAWEVEQIIDAAIDAAARNIYRLKRLLKRKHQRRLSK
jgi:hypothetical protein